MSGLESFPALKKQIELNLLLEFRINFALSNPNSSLVIEVPLICFAKALNGDSFGEAEDE